MSIKSRTSFIGLAILVAAAALAFHLFDPSKTRDRDEVRVTVLVTFEPVLRKTPVVIVVSVNSSPFPAESATESPQQETIPVSRGSRVDLVATQHEGSGPLTCSISANGKTVGPFPATATDWPKVQGCAVSIVA